MDIVSIVAVIFKFLVVLFVVLLALNGIANAYIASQAPSSDSSPKKSEYKAKDKSSKAALIERAEARKIDQSTETDVVEETAGEINLADFRSENIIELDGDIVVENIPPKNNKDIKKEKSPKRVEPEFDYDREDFRSSALDRSLSSFNTD